MTDDEITTPVTNGSAGARAGGLNYLAWLGPVVTVVGVLSYFFYFVQFADLRDFPWVNLPLVGLGVILSIAGLWRSFAKPEYRVLSKAFASLGFLWSLGLGVPFCFYIFRLSYQMPGVEGVAQVGDAAAAFSLLDQDNHDVQLADFQGQLLVINFYRGHW